MVHLGAGLCSSLQRPAEELQGGVAPYYRAVQRPAAAPEASRLAESNTPKVLALGLVQLRLLLTLPEVCKPGHW